MRLHLCCECLKRRERCKPTVRHIDGSIDYVCPQCAKALDYSEFMPDTFPQPKVPEWMARQAELARFFLKPVNPDDAEKLPDPDYGL